MNCPKTDGTWFQHWVEFVIQEDVMNSCNSIASYPSGIIGGPSAIEKRAVKSLGTVFALPLALALCGSAAVAQSATFHANGASTDASG
jgi:hypothetical protein